MHDKFYNFAHIRQWSQQKAFHIQEMVTAQRRLVPSQAAAGKKQLVQGSPKSARQSAHSACRLAASHAHHYWAGCVRKWKRCHPWSSLHASLTALPHQIIRIITRSSSRVWRRTPIAPVVRLVLILGWVGNPHPHHLLLMLLLLLLLGIIVHRGTLAHCVARWKAWHGRGLVWHLHRYGLSSPGWLELSDPMVWLGSDAYDLIRNTNHASTGGHPRTAVVERCSPLTGKYSC